MLKYKVTVAVIENDEVVYEQERARFAAPGDAIHWAETIGQLFQELGSTDTSVLVYKSKKLWCIAYSPEKNVVERVEE